MKNKNDKRGKSPANFYDRIAEMLNKAAIPQTITVEAEGVSPETFLATGITKRELYATVAMASLAHAVVTTPPTGGGRLRSDWARGLITTKKPDRIAVNSWRYRTTVSISTFTTYA